MQPDVGSTTIDAVLRRSATRHPDATAIEFEGETWTYRELDATVDAVAATLSSRRLRKGDRVAAYGGNSAGYVALFLACSRAGVVHVPINNSLTAHELAYLLEDSGAKLVVADTELTPRVEAASAASGEVEVLTFSSEADGILPPRNAGLTDQPKLDSPATASDLAQLLYTSGTTSRPKGAMMTHGALLNEYLSSIVALDFDATDRPLVCMPLYHSAGMHIFTLPHLMLGATLRILRKPDLPVVLRRIEEEKITSLFLAPTVWVPLAHHPDLETRDLTSLTKAQYGASIMPTPVLDRLRRSLPNAGFYNCFGQSEIGPLAAVLRPEEHDARPGSCGRPVLFVEARVVDQAGRDVEPGSPGEVIYRSPQLCRGYWNNADATSRSFVGGWFHSGDLVTRDEDGYLTVVDRLSDVINTGGVMVAPREIEDALYEHPSVAEVAVVGLPDDRWIEAITAYVVLKNGFDETTATDSLTQHLRPRLASFKIPKSIRFVDELPRNQSGKLLKRELRAATPVIATG